MADEETPPVFEAIHFDRLNSLLPRYLRICGRDITDALVDAKVLMLRTLLATNHVYRLDWLPNFITIPGYITLSKILLETISEEGIFPMDASSGVAAMLVESLVGTSSVRVLDMCCCPGGKLMSLVDSLSVESTLIGVDISSRRLETCLSLLNRHFNRLVTTNSSSSCVNDNNSNQNSSIESNSPFPRTLVMQCDATQFSSCASLLFDSCLWLEVAGIRGFRKRKNKSSRRDDAKRLRVAKETIDSREVSMYEGFDVVLVDAQCTHDGSYRHMAFAAPTSAAVTKLTTSQFLTEKVVTETCDLQRRLIFRAFELVSPGGSVIYSTCSEMYQQNEDVVQWLLDSNPSAQLEPLRYVNPIDIASNIDCCDSLSESDLLKAADELCVNISQVQQVPGCAGSLVGTVRFNRYSGTSGLFIAHIRKKKT